MSALTSSAVQGFRETVARVLTFPGCRRGSHWVTSEVSPGSS